MGTIQPISTDKIVFCLKMWYASKSHRIVLAEMAICTIVVTTLNWNSAMEWLDVQTFKTLKRDVVWCCVVGTLWSPSQLVFVDIYLLVLLTHPTFVALPSSHCHGVLDNPPNDFPLETRRVSKKAFRRNGTGLSFGFLYIPATVLKLFNRQGLVAMVFPWSCDDWPSINKKRNKGSGWHFNLLFLCGTCAVANRSCRWFLSCEKRFWANHNLNGIEILPQANVPQVETRYTSLSEVPSTG